MRALLFAATCVLAACKQAETPPPGSAVLAKVRALAAQMCACPDQACGTPLREEWAALTRGIGDSGTLAGVEFTAEQVEGLMVEDQRFMRCMDALAR